MLMIARPITPEKAAGPTAERRWDSISAAEPPAGTVASTDPGSADFAAAISSFEGSRGSPMRMKPTGVALADHGEVDVQASGDGRQWVVSYAQHSQAEAAVGAVVVGALTAL